MRDRHLLITGGTGGLGVAVTAAALDAGARVTVPVFAEEEIDPLLRAVGDARGRLDLPHADLRREDDVVALLERTGPLDAAVHLVGGFTMGPLHEADLDTLRAQFDLNVQTTFLVLKHALRAMRSRGYGRIVTVGSKAVVVPAPQMAIYAAAKAAVVAMTQTLAEEAKGTDITANCVLPTIIDTPANRNAMGTEQASRWVAPEDLARSILFLASPEAGHLRGSCLHAFGDV